MPPCVPRSPLPAGVVLRPACPWLFMIALWGWSCTVLAQLLLLLCKALHQGHPVQHGLLLELCSSLRSVWQDGSC